MTHGVAADVDEHLHVGAVRLAEHRRTASGHGLDGVGQADRQRMVRRHARRPEPAAGDLDGRGVVAQERVGGTGRVDRGPELGLGLCGGLPEPHAVAAVGGHPVEHGRRPLPARDDADDRRIREAEGRHQRIRLSLVAARLVGRQRLAEHEQVVERGHALAPLRRVGRAARARSGGT